MTLLKLITLSTILTLGACEEDTMQLVINLPNVFNQIIDVGKVLNLLRTSPSGYSNSGRLENSAEIEENEENKNQRKSGDNSAEALNIVKISFHGAQNIAKALKALRRAALTSRNALSSTLLTSKPSEDESPSMDNTLKSLININKKRDQLIREFNVKFPGLFDSSNVRRAEETKPLVELGPGAIKTEIVTYPPNFLASRLKHLLKIKKKQEDGKTA